LRLLSSSMSATAALNIVGDANAVAGGLDALRKLVTYIYDSVKKVKRQQKQCLKLAEFCDEIVKVLDHRIAEVTTPSTSLLAPGRSTPEIVEKSSPTSVQRVVSILNDLQKVLRDIKVKMDDYRHLDLWDAFVGHDKIVSEISDQRLALLKCFVNFEISSMLNLQKWTQDFEAEAKKDFQDLKKIAEAIRDKVTALESTSQRVDENLNAVHNLTGRIDDNVGEILAHVKQAMLEFQLRMRISSPHSREYQTSRDGLRALQGKSIQSLLELADLQGEARILGSKPFYQSAMWEIYEGRWLESDELKVAMKVLRGQHLDETQIRRIDRQIKVLRGLSAHPNIINYFGYCANDRDQLTLVFPLMENGDVMSYLGKNPNANRVLLVIEMARGLAHMHVPPPETSRGPVVHGSLMPSNVLISEARRALISDFGVARILEGNSAANLSSGSDQSQLALRYQAPELGSDGILSVATDVFAFGMTALEILSGKLPYYDRKLSSQVVLAIASGKRPSKGQYTEERAIDSTMWELLAECWDADASLRPTASDIVNRLHELYPNLVVSN